MISVDQRPPATGEHECSFCGDTLVDMVTGSWAFICFACIDIAAEIAAEKRARVAVQATAVKSEG